MRSSKLGPAEPLTVRHWGRRLPAQVGEVRCLRRRLHAEGSIEGRGACVGRNTAHRLPGARPSSRHGKPFCLLLEVHG